MRVLSNRTWPNESRGCRPAVLVYEWCRCTRERGNGEIVVAWLSWRLKRRTRAAGSLWLCGLVLGHGRHAASRPSGCRIRWPFNCARSLGYQRTATRLPPTLTEGATTHGLGRSIGTSPMRQRMISTFDFAFAGSSFDVLLSGHVVVGGGRPQPCGGRSWPDGRHHG